MLSREERARIKADIEQLEKFRDSCTDSGIRQLVEARIEAAKKNARETTLESVGCKGISPRASHFFANSALSFLPLLCPEGRLDSRFLSVTSCPSWLSSQMEATTRHRIPLTPISKPAILFLYASDH
jgi:hypothetical protein